VVSMAAQSDSDRTFRTASTNTFSKGESCLSTHPS
jgi:hypothetical protein